LTLYSGCLQFYQLTDICAHYKFVCVSLIYVYSNPVVFKTCIFRIFGEVLFLSEVWWCYATTSSNHHDYMSVGFEAEVLLAGCSSFCPTNSIRALKTIWHSTNISSLIVKIEIFVVNCEDICAADGGEGNTFVSTVNDAAVVAGMPSLKVHYFLLIYFYFWFVILCTFLAWFLWVDLIKPVSVFVRPRHVFRF